MGLSLTLLLSPYHQPELLKFCHPQAMNWVLTLEDTDHQGHSRRAQVLPTPQSQFSCQWPWAYTQNVGHEQTEPGLET